MARRILKKTRDRLIANLPNSIAQIEENIKELQKNQREIADRQAVIHEELKKEIKNSGFVKISENEILAKIFSGAKMYLDPGDIGLVPHLLLDGEWEHDVTQAWLSTIKPKDIVLDIGANFGYYGVLAVQQANRDCKVVMFEANPKLMPYLSKTITVNSFQDCLIAENYAVADKKGKVKLNILKDYIASSSIHDIDQLNEYNQNGAEFELESTVEVSALTIDDYCKDNGIPSLNVIKMDIEGYEDKAYAGMRKIIKASPSITLFVEFTKSGYVNPERFYNDMLEDFGNVYLISNTGKLTKPKSSTYKSVIGDATDWVMPVFSKKNLIDS